MGAVWVRDRRWLANDYGTFSNILPSLLGVFFPLFPFQSIKMRKESWGRRDFSENKTQNSYALKIHPRKENMPIKQQFLTY